MWRVEIEMMSCESVALYYERNASTAFTLSSLDGDAVILSKSIHIPH
jgi:hypothetical protein